MPFKRISFKGVSLNEMIPRFLPIFSFFDMAAFIRLTRSFSSIRIYASLAFTGVFTFTSLIILYAKLYCIQKFLNLVTISLGYLVIEGNTIINFLYFFNKF